MAKLTKDQFAVPDGQIYPKWFREGEEVTGDVAKAARSRGILAEEGSAKAAPRSKALKGAPENK